MRIVSRVIKNSSINLLAESVDKEFREYFSPENAEIHYDDGIFNKGINCKSWKFSKCVQDWGTDAPLYVNLHGIKDNNINKRGYFE